MKKIFSYKELKTDIYGLKFIPTLVNSHPFNGIVNGVGDDADWIEYGYIDNNLKSMQFLHEAVDKRHGIEFTDNNKNILKKIVEELKAKKNQINILEIGVGRSRENSSTHMLVNIKRMQDKYVGIDIACDQLKPYDNHSLNQYTFCCNSSKTDDIIAFCKNNKIENFDLIFIDGWHSITQVLLEWNLTKLLNINGYVGFHDTNYHPGPYCVFEAIDDNLFEKTKYFEDIKDDPGISFAKKIK